jgi:hypothetical protein
VKLEKFPRWCEAAELGLRDALGEYAECIREAVNVGRMELFRIDGHSWAVTEVREGTLVTWCYQGRGAVEWGAAMLRIARANRLEACEYTTPHRALGRMGRALGFELVSMVDGKLYRYQATVE